MIISASRRSDIPAFYGDWFIRRIREGYADVPNPIYPEQVSRVSLRPEDVDVFVFWSKNPAPFFLHMDELDRLAYKYFFLFTVNGYGRPLEPNVPPVEEVVRCFQKLSARIGKRRVIWRYDPIVLTDRYTILFHAEIFKRLAGELAPFTEKVIISVFEPYKDASVRMKIAGSMTDDADAVCEAAGVVADAARNAGLSIQSCADSRGLESAGIMRGKCIDDEYLRQVFSINASRAKDLGQRKQCLCIKSRDIGMYHTCPHLCRYCYANASDERVLRNYGQHNPESASLMVR